MRVYSGEIGPVAFNDLSFFACEFKICCCCSTDNSWTNRFDGILLVSLTVDWDWSLGFEVLFKNPFWIAGVDFVELSLF